MRYYYKSWERIFHSPDTDPVGAANPAANQGGGGGGGNDSLTTFTDPTAGLDLEDLDTDTRKIVEESRKGFAALQKQAADSEAARKNEELRRAHFQSNFDKVRVELERLNGGRQQQQADPRSERLAQLEGILVKKGVAAENAKVQAELMLDMMTAYGEGLKAEIGSDLRPFASTIIAREAEVAYGQSAQSDRVGALGIPEVAKIVQDQISEMVEHGQQVTKGVVDNLLGMAYFAHLQKGGQPPQQTTPVQQQQQQLPNVGRLTFVGAGSSPAQFRAPDPNAARTTLDSDTDAALQVVFGTWAKGDSGVKAPAYRPPAVKKGGR